MSRRILSPGGAFPVRVAAWIVLVSLVAGCSSRFPVLVKVDPTVGVPKAVDIVWVLTENDGVLNAEILAYKKKGMSEYFRAGRSNLSPGFFRFYRWLLPDEQWAPGQEELPLEVRSDPGATRPKLYGPYEQKVPKGTVKGFLFIEYGKGAEDALKLLPMMIYPALPTYPGYEEKNPKGISIEIKRDSCLVIPYREENPALIEEAELQRDARARAAGGS